MSIHTGTSAASVSFITEEEQAEREESNVVIMVLYWKTNSLGCVYYLHQFRELYFLVDTKNIGMKDIVVGLLDQIQPSHVILCKYNDPELTEIIQKHDQNIKIEIQDTKTFHFQKGQQELIHWYSQHSTTATTAKTAKTAKTTELAPSLSSPSMERSTSMHSTISQSQSQLEPYPTISDDDLIKQIYFQLSCIISMDSLLTISCVSPLFEALKSADRQFGSQNGMGMVPMSLQTISLPDTMYVPSDVLQSLEIFSTNSHPSTYQKKGRESTSLFNLLNHTVTPGGTHLLKQWLLRPTLNLNVIKQRQLSVEFIIQMEKNDIGSSKYIKTILSHLKHVKNMARILGRVYGHHASISEWHQLLKFIYHVIQLMGMLTQSSSTDAPIIQKALSIMDHELLKLIGQCINDTISFEESHVEGRLTVKPGIDAELDSLRAKYEALDEYLLEVVHELSSTLPSGVAHLLNVVYFPQLGYLLTLPSNAHDYFTEHSFLPGCDLQFTTQDYCYYKDDRTRDMDEELGDIHGMIVDKQIELIQELSVNIIQHQEQLLQISCVLAEFDCLISFSIAALQNNYVEPYLTDDSNELTIVQGRHPLQEHVMDTFIPNDTFMGGGDDNSVRQKPSTTLSSSSPSMTAAAVATETQDDSLLFTSSSSSPQMDQQMPQLHRVLFLTGANFSGKSVYLKQIGLIVYMAHIGSFVPAEKVVIGLVDKIFTSIQTAESVSRAHSAFGYDLMQISQAMRYATKKSIVIIDEFGKGTNTVDGASLFAAVLNEYVQRGLDCPKVIATTHYHELMAHDLLPPEGVINYYTTEIMYRVMTDDGISSLAATTTTTTMGDTYNNHAQQEQVVFLYRVVPGKGLGESFGRWCASLGGLPTSLLERAQVCHRQISLGEPYKIPWNQKDRAFYATLDKLLAQFMAIRDFDGSGATQVQDIMNLMEAFFFP